MTVIVSLLRNVIKLNGSKSTLLFLDLVKINDFFFMLMDQECLLKLIIAYKICFVKQIQNLIDTDVV